MFSVICIVPADLRDDGNKFVKKLGVSLVNDGFSIPLSATGSPPITHYACREWVASGSVEMVRAALSGVIPPSMPQRSAARVTEVRSKLANVCGHISSHLSGDAGPYEHMLDVLSAEHLVEVDAEETATTTMPGMSPEHERRIGSLEKAMSALVQRADSREQPSSPVANDSADLNARIASLEQAIAALVQRTDSHEAAVAALDRAALRSAEGVR